MEKTNKYYSIIENLVRQHKKFPGYEDIIEDIIDDVYSHSEVIINSINNDSVIKAYLEKVISTSIITVPKKLHFKQVSPNKSTADVNTELIDRMINSAHYTEKPSGDIPELKITAENSLSDDSLAVDATAGGDIEETPVVEELSTADEIQMPEFSEGDTIEQAKEEESETVELPKEEPSHVGELDIADEIQISEFAEDDTIAQVKEGEESETIELPIEEETSTIEDFEAVDEVQMPESLEEDNLELLNEEESQTIELPIEEETSTIEDFGAADEIQMPEFTEDDTIEQVNEEESEVIELPIEEETSAVEVHETADDIRMPEFTEDNTIVQVDEEVNDAIELPIEDADFNNEEDLNIVDEVEPIEALEEAPADIITEETALEPESEPEPDLEEVPAVDEPFEIIQDEPETFNLDEDYNLEEADSGELLEEFSGDSTVSLDLEEDVTPFELEEQTEDKEEPEQPSDTVSVIDYSVFNYEPEIDNDDIDVEGISKELVELNHKRGDLNILKVYELKYKENLSVQEIALQLEMSEYSVIEALSEIIAVV